eukprot:symbB.v1.2.024418.t1/scaffold2309.1/size82710/4
MDSPDALPVPTEMPSPATSVVEHTVATIEEAPTVDATAGFSARPELNFSSAVVGASSSAVLGSSPEMPVPTELPSPSSPAREVVETMEAPTRVAEESAPQDVKSGGGMDLGSSAVVGSSGVFDSGPPASPTELPVPTDLPSPTPVGDEDPDPTLAAPAPREPTDVVHTSSMERTMTVPSRTASSFVSRGTVSSPADVPVPTLRPSPSEVDEMLPVETVQRSPIESGAFPSSAPPQSPDDEIAVPTQMPSPTMRPEEDEAMTDSVPPLSLQVSSSHPSTATLSTLSVPPPPAPEISAPSSPADVPVPTQMASPTSGGEEDEEVTAAVEAHVPLESAALESGSAAVPSPTEMAVPTEMPSPSPQEDQVETLPPLVSAALESASALAPSPTEMAVPTCVPSPSSDEEGMEAPATEVPTVLAPTISARPGRSTMIHTGVATSPAELPVPTHRPSSPTEPMEEEALPPISAAISAGISGSVPSSPDEVAVPTELPSPTMPPEEDDPATETLPQATAVPTRLSDPTMTRRMPRLRPPFNAQS